MSNPTWRRSENLRMRRILPALMWWLAMGVLAMGCFKSLPKATVDGGADSKLPVSRLDAGSVEDARNGLRADGAGAPDLGPHDGAPHDGIAIVDGPAADASFADVARSEPDVAADYLSPSPDQAVDGRHSIADGPLPEAGAAADTRECSAGARRCSAANAPEVCTNAGAWMPMSKCPFVCAGGACSGECVPDARRCAGTRSQVCSKAGSWEDATVCPFTCVDGGCTGECSPGSKRCADSIPQTCGPMGVWASGAACQFVCQNSACAGDCVPGTKRCASGVAEACGADGRWASTGGDCAAPMILSVRPADGATGVSSGDTIEITFSEPMNKGATQGAFTTTDFPLPTSAFEWPAPNILRIRPPSGFAYAEGGSVTIPARTYSVAMTTTATDDAGNRLSAARAWSFSTLRRISAEAPLIPELSGFVLAGGTTGKVSDGAPLVIGGDYRSFVSFSIASIPPGARIERAVLRLFQTGADEMAPPTSTTAVEDVSFVALNSALYSATGAGLGALTIRGDKGWTEKDVTGALEGDQDVRASGADRSQYLLKASAGLVSFQSGGVGEGGPPVIAVRFLIP